MREVEEEEEEQGGERQRRHWGNREASKQGRRQSQGGSFGCSELSGVVTCEFLS